VTPRERAARLSDAEVRAAWRKATVAGRVGPFAEEGLSVERALAEAGLETLVRFACANPVLHVALDDDALLVVALDDGGPAAIMLEDGPELAALKAAAYEVLDALDYATEPHDAATLEAATKAAHALAFARDDVRRLTR
jgi:hypothetical protein